MNKILLLNLLTALFPGSLYPRDYTVAVDSSGNATIALWNTELGSQPTADQLTAELAAWQLQQAQQTQAAVIAAASVSAQTTGFTSSALGSAYSYPSTLQDQANLNATVTRSMLSDVTPTWTCLFWCKSSAGVQNFVAHTAVQIQQVAIDAYNTIMTLKGKQATLTAQILAATTIAAVQAIVW